MVGHEDIRNLVSEWRLREDVIEKDYVIGWVLWAIGSDPDIGHKWVFKGGTCIKKCYIETYRFSEDLDFTVLPDGPIRREELLPILDRILKRVAEESDIDFSVAKPKFKERESPLSVEVRIYYRGPRRAPSPAGIKLDLSASEKIARSPVLREVAHPYPDELPHLAQIRCYAFEELFAEKIRAMGERSRPRDLYDIINLFRRRDLQDQSELIRSVLVEKCETKGVAVPSLTFIENSPYRDELESEWENMLGHQVQMLPPFDQFWEQLPRLFGWLEGTYVPERLASVPIETEEDTTWAPPPTTWSWGIGIPLESIRFAAANHLCLELGYRNSKRIIEPYSLRRTKDGNLLLHAIRVPDRGHRSYRVDRIQSVRVTKEPFKPVYQIEFSQTGPMRAPPTSRKSSQSFPSEPKRRKTHLGPTYIFKCSYCGKKFKRTRYNSRLNPHKDRNGYNCPGRTGYFVETRYH